METNSKLFILSNGRVAALDKSNGEIIWEIKLKDYVSAGGGRAIGQILLDNNRLFVGVSGIVLCLNPETGAFLWKNELKGWGYSFVSLAGADASSEANVAASQAASSAASAAVIASTVAATS